MSVTASTAKVQYTLTTATDVLSVPFYFLENSHLRVIRTRADVETVLTTGFSLSGAGVPAGGTLTLDGTQTAIADRITIKRNVPLTQLTTYVTNDRFPSATMERNLDALTMLVQQASEKADRALSFGEGETASPALSVVDRASKVLGFDEDGAIEFTDSETFTAPAQAAADAAALSETAAYASETSAAASAVTAANQAAAAAASAVAANNSAIAAALSAAGAALIVGCGSGDFGGTVPLIGLTSLSTNSGNLTLSPASVSSGMSGGYVNIPAGPVGEGIGGGYAPIRWGNAAKYSLVGGANAFDIDGGTSGGRIYPDNAGGIAYNAQETHGDVKFGWQFESRYAGTTELYYAWSGIQPGQVGARRPIQLNTSWGVGFGTGAAWPGNAAAGTTAMTLHVDQLTISGNAPFTAFQGMVYTYNVSPTPSTFDINAAVTVDSLTVEGAFTMTNGLLNVTSGAADVALLKNAASSAAIRWGRDFTNNRNSGNLQFEYVGSGSALNRMVFALYGLDSSLAIYETATASNSTITGAAVVTGGLGVSGAINLGGALIAGSYLQGTRLFALGGSSYEVAELSSSNAFGVGIRFGRDISNTRNSGLLAFNFVSTGSASNNVGIGLYGIADSVQVFQNGTASTSRITGTVTVGGGLGVAGVVNADGFEGVEQGSAPAAPATNGFKIYARDNGSGKTALFVRFATGAEQQVAIEP